MSTVRIGFVGPANCGKTTIAEFYTEVTTEPNFSEYRPTQGLRILETGRKIHSLDNPVQVQVWDISGDIQYESYLTRLSMQLDGVVIVCPGTDLRLTQTCKKYYQLIVDEERVGKYGHVICMLHKPVAPVAEDVYIEDKQLASIPVYRTCMEVESAQISEIIDQLVEKIAKKQQNEGEFFE
ncbi:Rab-like_protein 5 [Hexamita inflata]|uniref:Rab-like protein 5 n=1 Tax=Hexamita inflata TaxID=28002 RepID=A0AA86QAD6_9EUKA|nr:Rab-like protein 5 [Hexamita inflata]CAI9959411.1 Rab-like protein 5 [Hexamita inflata]CAI9969504.1 Rab-like protein 5 [Hexamita inflata]